MVQYSPEEKIIALEEKSIFQEDAIQKLDDVIARQYRVIETLARRLKLLEDKVDGMRNEIDRQPANTFDEKPPHY